MILGSSPLFPEEKLLQNFMLTFKWYEKTFLLNLEKT